MAQLRGNCTNCMNEMTPDEVMLLSALNEAVPVIVSGERESVAPGQASANGLLVNSRQLCWTVHSPIRSPPQGAAAGQVDPLLSAPALLPAPLELEPEDPLVPEPAKPFEPDAPFEPEPPP